MLYLGLFYVIYIAHLMLTLHSCNLLQSGWKQLRLYLTYLWQVNVKTNIKSLKNKKYI